jgi:hypothetical protein
MLWRGEFTLSVVKEAVSINVWNESYRFLVVLILVDPYESFYFIFEDALIFGDFDDKGRIGALVFGMVDAPKLSTANWSLNSDISIVH